MYFEIIEGHMVPHHVEFSNDREYDNFLQGKVFEDMTEIVLENITSGTIISVKDTMYCMYCTSDNCSIEISLSNGAFFLPPLHFEISRTGELIRIPYNSTSFKKESLRQMDLLEGDESHSTMKKAAILIFNDNSMLDHEE